jgi:hypothetical protein
MSWTWRGKGFLCHSNYNIDRAFEKSHIAQDNIYTALAKELADYINAKRKVPSVISSREKENVLDSIDKKYGLQLSDKAFHELRIYMNDHLPTRDATVNGILNVITSNTNVYGQGR